MINSFFGNVNNIAHLGCNTQVFEKPLKLNKENTILQNALLGRTSEWRKKHRDHTIADIGGDDVYNDTHYHFIVIMTIIIIMIVLTWCADQNWPQMVFLALPSAPINSAACSNFSLASIHCTRKQICCA